MKTLFLLVLAVIFVSCKKEKTPLDPPSEIPSERFVVLTHHNWSMTHEYIDSTAYAKSHLSEWPLSSTDDFMDMHDTCSWDSKSVFYEDGRWKLIKSPKCDASISSDVGNWKLINNDNDFVIVGQDTMHIVELTNNDLKMYYESYTWVGGNLVLTEYIMWTFKSSN